MKKYLLLIIVLIVSNICFGQYLDMNCGTRKIDTSYSAWETIDTIGKRKILFPIRNWVYNSKDEPLQSNNQFTLAYCPCGCPNTRKYLQYRVCKLTGIMQRRFKEVYSYTLPATEKPKTEYEIVIDSLDAIKIVK